MVPSLLLLTLAAAAEPAAARTGIYAGWLDTPGWDNSFVARTNGPGTKAKSFVVGLSARCGGGGTYYFHDDIPVEIPASSAQGLLVPSRNRGGRLKAVYRNAGMSGEYELVEKLTVAGRFKRRSARGTVRMRSSAYDPASGAQVAGCDSQRLKWSLRRHARRIYGGASSQDEPVALYLNKKRTRVREIGVNWHSSCADGGYIDVPNAFTNFRIRKGARFGDIWGDSFKGTRYEYHLRGRVKRRSARGAFEVDAFPSNGTSCGTGNLTWRTRTG